MPGVDGNVQWLKQVYNVDILRYGKYAWIGCQYAMPEKTTLLVCSDMIMIPGMDGNIQCLKRLYGAEMF